jgi:predicted MFS family arabinose efflux permease
MSHGHQAQAAGCQITKDDTQRVIGSLTCSAAYGVYGACFSSLGAALPELADSLGKTTGDFGISFTTRGVGYLIGTLLSSQLMGNPNIPLSKPFLACLFLIINGVAMFLVAEANDFILLMILFSLQGVGFGGIDMMCNCAVPELWGLRAQPWMQGFHFFTF